MSKRENASWTQSCQSHNEENRWSQMPEKKVGCALKYFTKLRTVEEMFC